jgi:FAD:protein FMN transferase
MYKIIFILIALQSCTNSPEVKIERQSFVMGSLLNISLLAKDTVSADDYINFVFKMFQDADNLWSDFKDNSLITMINKNAGKDTVDIDSLTYELFQAADSAYHATDGYFNICVGVYSSSFNEGRFDSIKSDLINYKNFYFDKKTAYLRKRGMKLSVNGLVVGFILNKIKEASLVKFPDIYTIFINHSGDIYYLDKLNQETIELIVKLSEEERDTIRLNSGYSLAVSGNSETMRSFNGKNYGHIINPKSNYYTKSVHSEFVIHKSPLWADILSTVKASKK